MSDKQHLISDAFKTFMSEQPEHAHAWGGAVAGLGKAGHSALLTHYGWD